ncbi:hypothetical protein JKF63_05069 [Porcisia hertigi]|uniref:Uncharacterized protein n=1 Tax=Porcisia hertigi TaxID=2761500 RepID=A0A836LI71_9TRYP|nr:hypothetical protein JKF63_05069 [Porcisia hertigi]
MGAGEKTEDVDVDVFSAAAAPHTSSQVGHIFSPSTLTSKGDVLPGLPALSCPPPITASLLPHLVPVGREACHSDSPRNPQMAVNTDTLQQAEEDLDGGMESVANRCRRSKDKPASMFEAQSTCVSGSSDGGSGGVGGDFWSQPLGAIYRRQFSSRSGSPAKLSPPPSRPEGGEEGHTVRGDKVKWASEVDFCPRKDSAMRALEGCASAAPRVHGLPPSVPSVTVSAAQDTQHTSSTARSSSLAGAAATTMAIGLTTPLPPASSRTAHRLSASQIPLAEERPAGSSAVASAVVDAHRSTSGLKRSHVVKGGLEPRVDGKECGEAPQVDVQWPEGPKCSLDVLPHAQVGRQVAGGCSSMTSTGPSSPAVLPPPPLLPSVYPSDFVWSRTRTTVSNADSTNGHLDYGYENAITDDFAAAATPRLLTYPYFHPHQFQLEAPSVLGGGVISPATVTDTTARVSPQWPFVSALPEVAAAESGDSAITALFASLGAAADVRVKGQRSASQSAIIAVWNRMDVRSGAAAEGEIGEGPSYRHQLAAVGDEEADHRDYSHRSRADLADALPVRHRGVGARRRKPPILFPPSPESVKLCDAAPKGISVPSSFRMQVDAPVKARSASLPASIHTAAGITASRTAMSAQEPQQKPVGRVEGEELLRLTGGVSMSPREFPFVFDAFTMTPPRSATRWSCPKRSRGSDASTSVGYPLPKRIPVPVSVHDTGSRGSVVVNTQPPLRPVMAYDDDDVSSGTATTVDAGEDDRISEGGGGAADRYIMRRGSQPLCHHQLRRRSSPNSHSLKSYTSGFTTRHTTVVATSTVTKLVLSPHTHSLRGRPRLGLIKSSSFAPNMSSEAPFEIREFAHSSPASPRSRVTAHSPLERVAATLSVEEDNIDGVDPRPARDAGVAHRPLSQNDNEPLWRLAGHDVSPFNRRFLSSPLITSRSDSLVSDATEMSTQGNSGGKGRASLQCNGCQPLRRHGQPTPAQSTSSFSPTARLMPQRQGRFILTPHSTSLLSVGASRDELGCVVGGFPSTPRSERGLNSLGILPLAQQPGMQPHRRPQPPLSTSLLRVAQSPLRHISDVWGNVRWQEVSLHASSGQASQNLDLARNSRDDDDDDDGNISLRHDTLEDEEVDAVADEGNAEGGRNDDAQWRAVRLLLGSAGERTGDDSDDVFLCDERNEASMWGIEIPEKCQGGGDEDVNDGVCEEGVGSNLGGNTAGRSINCDDCSVNGRCLGLPKPSPRRPSATSFLAGTLPTMDPQPLPQRSCHAANVSHDLSPYRATEEGISHSSARTRTVAETLPRFPQPRYEPPMPSNKNSFTAFVPLSAISPSQLLSTVAIVLQCAHDANLPGASPGVRDSEAAAAGGDGEAEPCAGSQGNTSVTADTLVLNGCDPKDDHLVDVANVTEGSTLLISPLYSPVSTSLTKRISRSNTRAPVAPQAATVRQTLQSPVQQATHTRSETLDTLYGSTPCTSRKATKGLPGSSHFAAAVAVSSGGGGDGSRGDAGGGGGSADLPMQVARSAVVSPQTSRSPGSASVACASFSESERHMLSEKQRPPLELFLHTPPWFHNTAAAPRASRMTVDIFGLESAQFSASQPLPGQWSRPQPWWNQRRSTAVPEASDTSDTRDHLPCSPRTTKSALPVRLGGRVASLSSPSGAAAMAAGPPAGHRMPLCGSAVATTIEAGASGGRLRLMSQYPITTTNDHRSGLARGGSGSSCSSSAKSDRGEDASLSGVAGAAVHHEPNGGVFINRMCSYDVQVRGDSECIHEKVVSGVAGIEARVALVAGRTSHDRDGDDGSQPEKSVHTPASSLWVSLSPAVPRCATTASAAEVVGANNPSETERTLSSPTQTIFTVPAVPPTAPRVEEPEGQLARDALPHALSAPSVAGEPCCNESVAPCDTEALEDGGERRKRPCVGIAIPPPRDTDTSGGNLNDTIRTALAKKPVSAALYIEEMEVYARICIEETAAGVREAWVAMWDSLNLQRQQLLLPKQCLSTTAPLPPFFPLCRRGPVKILPLGSNSSVVGGAQGGSSAGTGPGAGATLMDDCVTGLMRVNPSGSTAEAASAVLRDDTPNAGNATGVIVLPLAPPFDAVVGDSTRVTGGVEVGGSGDLRDGQCVAHGDAGVEAMHKGFPPLFVERLTGSRSETAPLIALHSSVRSRGAGAALEVDHLVTSHGQPTLLRATHSPYQPDQPVTFCAANSPVSPTHAPSRTPLHQHREIVGNTRTASRGQTPSTSDSGLGVSLFPPFEGPTPHTRAPSRLQRQPRDSRVGRTVCRWCGKPHTSAVVCPVALRPHTELRKERRMEKAAKRAAQGLLCEGRISEAVAILRGAGVCPQ